jgi:hypothetical protein
LSRLAADRVPRSGIKLEPLLLREGMSIEQIDDPVRRISASKQIASSVKRASLISKAPNLAHVLTCVWFTSPFGYRVVAGRSHRPINTRAPARTTATKGQSRASDR